MNPHALSAALRCAVCAMLFFVTAVACGSSTGTAATTTVQNPNFDNGLDGWKTTGNVTIVDIQTVPGVTKGAELMWDGVTPPTLSQTFTLPQDANIALTYYVSSTPGSGISLTWSLDGNARGIVSSSGDPNFAPFGMMGPELAGDLTYTFALENASDSGTSGLYIGTTGTVTAVHFESNTSLDTQVIE